MGTRGPIPKRSTERRRRNTPAAGEITKSAGSKRVPVPRADPDWHPLARRWYNALSRSGQARFYEPSDWAFAYSLADDLSYYKSAERRSGQMLASIYAGMERLLTTEGDRRRASLELERPGEAEEAPAGVTALDDYRAALGG